MCMQLCEFKRLEESHSCAKIVVIVKRDIEHVVFPSFTLIYFPEFFQYTCVSFVKGETPFFYFKKFIARYNTLWCYLQFTLKQTLYFFSSTTAGRIEKAHVHTLCTYTHMHTHRHKITRCSRINRLGLSVQSLTSTMCNQIQ